MIKIFKIVKVEDGYACVKRDDDNTEIVGRVYPTPTQSFYYNLKELDSTCEGPFVVKYYKKEM